jgi:hypothetical protein
MTSFLKNMMSNLSLGAATLLTEFSASLKDEEKKQIKQFTEICETCGAAIILCHWENGGVYWRHTGTTTTECKKAALKESSMHKYAKRYLVTYLNKGGKAEFVFSYKDCVHKLVTPLPSSVVEYREEVEHYGKDSQRCVFDIAGLDKDGKIVCAIEIWYKHKTDNLTPREDIVWVEARAGEVLDKLCVEKVETPLLFTDHRVLEVCPNPACNSVKIHAAVQEEKFLLVNMNNMSNANTSIISTSTLNTNTSTVNVNMLVSNTSTFTSNTSTFTSNTSTFTPNTSYNLHLASTLGYLDLSSPYECEARRIQDAAIKGTYFQCPLWNTVGLEGDKDLETSSVGIPWISFLKEGNCLKCQTPAKIAFKRPFCYSCYKDIRSQTGIVTISADNKVKLRQALGWIKDLPGGWRPGAPCFYCKRTYISKEENNQFRAFWHPGTQQVYTFVWWFGDKKCCCSVCLQEKVDSLGIKL